MSLYIDRKYVMLLAPKLEHFHQKSEYLWNFRCNICGDSKKNKSKTRAYVYRRKSDLFFTCHNCGTSLSFGNLLKVTDRSLYSEYQMERYKDSNAGNVPKPDFSLAKTKPIFNLEAKITLPSITSLPLTHYAREYIQKRRIPKEYWDNIFYAENYGQFIMEMLPEYEKKVYNEPRIVFPFYDQDKKLLGFQGRAIDPENKVKYITVKLDDSFTKVYGLDRVDLSKKVYVCEGPIDSLFLHNGIATMDSTLSNISLVLGNRDYIFIHDNEPRNPEIVRQMNKTISQGKKIFIWPQDIVSKDINDWIMTGATPSEIQSIIDSNTFEGLRARLEYDRWRKV